LPHSRTKDDALGLLDYLFNLLSCEAFIMNYYCICLSSKFRFLHDFSFDSSHRTQITTRCDEGGTNLQLSATTHILQTSILMATLTPCKLYRTLFSGDECIRVTKSYKATATSPVCLGQGLSTATSQ